MACFQVFTTDDIVGGDALLSLLVDVGCVGMSTPMDTRPRRCCFGHPMSFCMV